MKFYPNKKGGRTSFSHTEGGGGANIFEVVLTLELSSFSHADWGAQKVSTF